MSSSRSLVLSAVAAAIMAIVLVSGVVAVGVLNTTHSTVSVTVPPTVSSQSNRSPQTTTQSIPPVSSGSTGAAVTSPTTTATSQSESTSGPVGALAVLMTDPPTVPEGVTNVFITYANLGIHVSGAGNDTGWHVLNVQGQIDLMSIINSTQTIAAANISSGNFNALEFNVTSAIVTFTGQNYTADLVYQHHALYVPIVGGISITGGQTSAAVIDVSPTVLLLGNTTDPTFAFIPDATAYTVPAQSVSTLHLQVGNRDNIQNASWWVKIQQASKFEITSAILTPTELSFTVENTGDAPVVLRIADLASTTSLSGGKVPLSNFASLLMISEVFVLQSNSTIRPITVVGNGVVESTIDNAGILVPAGRSETFTFNGNVTLGVAITSISKHFAVQQIVPGQTYILSLTGNGLIAQMAVTAGS